MNLADIKAVEGNINSGYWSSIFRMWMRVRFSWVKLPVRLKSFGGMPFFYASSKAQVQLGEGLTFVNSTRFNGIGLNKRCSIVVGKNALLAIGDYSGLSGVSIFCAEKVIIGSHVMLGGNVCIWDSNFHSLSFEERKSEIKEGMATGVEHKPINIRDGAFIGANSIILKGVTIGEQSIVGAGSVVTCDVPGHEVWAGNPAKFIRKTDS